MSKCNLKVGVIYEFQYPRHNFYGVVSYSERRRVRVNAIRDLNAEPLDSLTSMIQPLLRRGRFLIEADDLEKQAVRHFYLESMREIKAA